MQASRGDGERVLKAIGMCRFSRDGGQPGGEHPVGVSPLCIPTPTVCFQNGSSNGAQTPVRSSTARLFSTRRKRRFLTSPPTTALLSTVQHLKDDLGIVVGIKLDDDDPEQVLEGINGVSKGEDFF